MEPLTRPRETLGVRGTLKTAGVCETFRSFSWLELLISQLKRLADELELLERNLPCKSVKRHKIRRTIFEVTDDVFSEQKIKWRRSESASVCVCVCVYVCADGAVAMAAGLSGLVLWVKKTTYRNYREVLVSKNLNPILPETFTGAVKVIYINQSRPLNARLFRHLYAEVDSEPTVVRCRRILDTQNVTPLLSHFAGGYLTYIYIYIY